MDYDFVFIAKMLKKHAAHLEAQKGFIEGNLKNYQRAIDSMERIGDEKKYRTEIQRQEFKKAEALEKLSHVIPNIEKINEQIVLLESN